MSTSLYERIGGQVAVLAAVQIFYKRVLEDELTGKYFASLDMNQQIKKQVAFMTWAFGGPSEYKGRDLREAHAPLVKQGLNRTHFAAVAGHLRGTLEELGVEESMIAEALAIVGGTRAEVLGE